MFMRLLLLAALLLAFAAPATATEFYQVGFRTLGQCTADGGLRLDVNVWYPSVRAPHTLNYAPWTISAARNGKAVEGRFPLILLSHDTAGTRFSYHDTAAWLASCGFVVAAPAHLADCMDNMENLLTWAQLQGRTRELSATIDLLLADSDTEPSIDKERISALGFGSGATAVLLLGGALPDCDNRQTYCAQAPAQDMYCNAWGRERMDGLCRRLPLTKSLADTRIKAIAAVAPGFGMLFSRASFRWLHPPLLLMAAAGDTLNKTPLHSRHIYDMMEKKPRWISLEQADAGALMASCPPPLQDALPEICRSVSAPVRAAIHKSMHTALEDFFLHYLGSEKNLPHIPPPPDLTPPPPPPAPPAAAPVQKKEKGKRKNRP